MLRRPRSLASTLVPVLLVAGVVAGCDSDSGVENADGEGGAATLITAAPELVAEFDLPVRLCSQIPDQTDSLDFAGVQRTETPSGALTGQALAYALQFPYYVTAWTRSLHESWVIVGVSGGMRELQFDLDTLFPGARVLAMNIDWNEQQLAGYASEISAALTGMGTVSWSTATGLVAVDFPELDDPAAQEAARAALAPYEGLPICVTVAGR